MNYPSKKLIAVLPVLIAFLASSPAFAESGGTNVLKSYAVGDPSAGKEKSYVCQGCHGEDGNSTDEQIPKLAGQFEKYLAKQMFNFQTGARTHGVFDLISTPLTDKDLEDIAAYYSNQPRMKGDQSSGSSLGMKIFTEGELTKKVIACVTCHGVRGKGLFKNVTMFPVVGGQHKIYIKKQLTDFRADTRSNSPSDIMNRITRNLSDSDIEALASYLSVQ